MDRLWRSNSSISPKTSCPLGIVNDEVSKQHLSMIRKSNFVKTSFFKISDDQTPITSLIEQPNSTNESFPKKKCDKNCTHIYIYTP